MLLSNNKTNNEINININNKINILNNHKCLISSPLTIRQTFFEGELLRPKFIIE